MDLEQISLFDTVSDEDILKELDEIDVSTLTPIDALNTIYRLQNRLRNRWGNSVKTISVLDKNTIDKIAAGEVIERPSSIVKELVENAIDAGSNAVTVEIKDGGTTLVRITDNGEGIAPTEVKKAFHAPCQPARSRKRRIFSVSPLWVSGERLFPVLRLSARWS